MSGIWVSPSQYVELAEGDQPDLTALGEEIASRQAAWDWEGVVGLLPDPDPVLRTLDDGGVAVLEGLTGDAHVISAIQQRKLGTLKREFRWEPGTLGEQTRAEPAAVRLRDALVEDLERVDLYSLLSAIIDAAFYGMTPVEILWEPGQGRLRIADLQVKPARWFGFDAHNQPRFVSQANPWDGETLPFGKFVFARHFPTYDNPYGLRLLSRCFWPVAFKKGGIRFWVTLAEKYGIPFLVGKYRPGAPAAEQADMLSKLVAMVQDAVAVIPQGGTVEILEAAGKGASAEIHRDLVATMDAEISKVLVGQTLTTVVGDRGSYAASKTHENVLEDFRAGDQTLGKTVLEEIAWVYGRVNAPGVPTPELVWFEEEDPKQDTAERDQVLGAGGLRFTKAYYQRQYGFKDDEIEVGATGRSPVQGQGQGQGHTDEHGPSRTDTDAGGAAFAAAPGADAPDTPEALVARLEAEAAGQIAGLVETVRGLVEGAESLEALQAALEGAYPQLDAAGLAGIMTEALAAAALAGRWELLEGV